jgi:protein TonB
MCGMKRLLFANLCVVCVFVALAGAVTAAQQGSSVDPAAGSAAATDVAPVPNADGIYRVGHGVVAPKPIFLPDPQFSEEARRKKVSGRCTVGLIVNVDGTVRNVHVVRSIAEEQTERLQKAALSLDEKAVEAVRGYRFRPATLDSKPVPVELRVQVSFDIH